MWLYLIGANAAVIAVVALMIGAWPVVPFAGLEVTLVAIAFWIIGRHDKDIETLSVNTNEFSWRRQHGQAVDELSGNAAWVQFLSRQQHRRQQLFLRYKGREVHIGSDLSDDAKMRLAKLVGARINKQG